MGYPTREQALRAHEAQAVAEGRLANKAVEPVRPASLVDRSGAVSSYAAEVAIQAEGLVNRLVGAVPNDDETKGQSIAGDGMLNGVRYDLNNIEDRLSEISRALQRLAKAVG